MSTNTVLFFSPGDVIRLIVHDVYWNGRPHTDVSHSDPIDETFPVISCEQVKGSPWLQTITVVKKDGSIEKFTTMHRIDIRSDQHQDYIRTECPFGDPHVYRVESVDVT